MSELTTLLGAARGGDARAAGTAFGPLHDEPHRAARARPREHRTTTLPDAMGPVHESDLERLGAGGLQEAEIAAAPGVSGRIVRRDGQRARSLQMAAMS